MTRIESGNTLPRIKQLDGRPLFIDRAVTITVVFAPMIGTVCAVLWSLTHGLSALDVGLFFGFYILTMWGLTAGFHRLFSHSAFEAHPAVVWLLGILGSMALQGPIIRWAADHRRHHQYTDQSLDPHSPVAVRFGPGGFIHAHIGWLFSSRKASIRAYVPDLVAHPVVRNLDRLYPVWAVLTLALPAILGGLLSSTADGAISGFLWGGVARICAVHQATWLVNSVCHLWGARPQSTRDHSTNNAFVALLTLGEGWHNDHHRYPHSARMGLAAGQVDPTWLALRALARFGLVQRMRSPQRRRHR